MTYESRPKPTRGPRPERMPGKVRGAVVGLWFQTVVSALAVLLLFMDAQDRADHGQDGAGALREAGVICLLLVALLAGCAVMAVRGTPWVWWAAIALQVISVAGGLIILVSGGLAAIVGIAIEVGIGWLLWARESQEWFGRRRSAA